MLDGEPAAAAGCGYSVTPRTTRPAYGLLAAMLDEDEGVMLGEQEQVLVEGLRSGLVVTLSRW